jgi:UDP-N-acetylmuramoylalanine--D-glutamate ligase
MTKHNPLTPLRGDALREYLKGRKVSVVGLGQSGIAAARLLLKLGAHVFVSEFQPQSNLRPLPEDLCPGRGRKIDYEFGGHSKKILRSDLVVVSPGVPLDHPVLRQALKQKPVWSELELGTRLTFFKQCAAITGTNGKTTTVSLLGDMCRRSGRRTFVGGNIGQPVCGIVEANRNFDSAVLEVSSYQLESSSGFRPDVAAVLNLTNDHLHRHKTMQGYAQAKERIFRNQGSSDCSVLNASDPWCLKMAKDTRGMIVWFSAQKKLPAGVFYDASRKKIVAKFKGLSRDLEFPLPAHLPGLHNIENACAAVACALGLGVPVRAISESLLNFPGVPHRLEPVQDRRGVRYVNDSKGTNVDSTLKAVQAYSRPLWLILGGQDKGGSYQPLKQEILRRKRSSKTAVKGAFLIGEAASKIAQALKGTCELIPCQTLDRAVRESSHKAVRGDIVLLSPACASFDQFKNFEDRGARFKQLVAALKD